MLSLTYLLWLCTLAPNPPQSAEPPTSRGLEIEDLLFLIEGRDRNLSSLAFPFRVIYDSTDDCTFQEEGWWYCADETVGTLLLAGCKEGLPTLEWTVGDGSRTYDASAPADWGQLPLALEPPAAEIMTTLHISRQLFGGRLSEPTLPGEFGLNMLNTPWSKYLDAFPQIEIFGQREHLGHQCVDVLFDMDKESTGPEFGFPWLLSFDLESMLAVRVEAFQPYEDGLRSYLLSGQEGEPPFIELGGERWTSLQLTEVLEVGQVAGSVQAATRGRFRLGPPWDATVAHMEMDAAAALLDREVIEPMLKVVVHEQALVRDDTLLQVASRDEIASTNVGQTLQVGELLGRLGLPRPKELISPFADSFYQASALFFISNAEGIQTSLKGVLESFPVDDRVRKSPTYQDTLTAAEKLGLHGVFLDVEVSVLAEEPGWMLTSIQGLEGTGFEGAVIARIEGDQARVIGQEWSDHEMPLTEFEARRSGPILLFSSSPISIPTQTGFKGWIGMLGLALIAFGLLMAAWRKRNPRPEPATLGTALSVLLLPLLLIGCGQAAIGAGTGASSEADGPLVIIADDGAYDAGEVDQHALIEHTFLITNVSERIVELGYLWQSCSCTSLAIDKERIAPGESAALNVVAQFDSNDFGLQKIEAAVYELEGDQLPLARVTLQARVGSPAILAFEDGVVDFGEVVPGVLARASVQLDVIDLGFGGPLDPTLHITDAPPGIRAWLEPDPVHSLVREQPRTRYTVTLELTAEQTGLMTGTLEARTLAGSHTITDFLSLRARTASPIEASPKEVFVGRAHRGETLRHELTIRSDLDLSGDVQVTSSQDWIRGRLDSAGSLLVEVEPSVLGKLDESLLITLGTHTHTIPVRGWID